MRADVPFHHGLPAGMIDLSSPYKELAKQFVGDDRDGVRQAVPARFM
jgi:hypothetical protein